MNTVIKDVELRYWCFLSYSSRDNALSRRLYHALETYRIPRDLVGRPGRDGPIPKRLFPCFRDRDELPLSSDLGGTIQDALRASRYLIVICTPASAQSRWVNEEVLYFKSLCRADRILALIAAGEPNASDIPGREKEECFCPALRHVVDQNGQLTSDRSEPIAGDLRKGGDGWTNAFLKAVAGITGLGFNAFAQREHKRRRRQQILVGALALTVCAAGLWYWDYTRVKTDYYRALTSRWSIPEGVIRLSAEQASHSGWSYKIESSRGEVLRVTLINGSGYPSDDDDWHGGSTKEIHYRENGALDYISYRNHNDKEVFREVYSDLQDDDSGARRHYVDFKLPARNTDAALGASAQKPGVPVPTFTMSEITGQEVDYNSAGLTERIQFRNSSGSLRAEGDGVFGQYFEYNALGLVSKKEDLGAEGQPLPDRRGVAARVYSYDSAGNETSISYLGADGNPALDEKGRAKVTSKYDEFGNEIGRRCYGINGKPVLDNRGFSEIASRYDERGNEIERDYLGSDGQPTINKSGYAKFTARYDERGNLIEKNFFGIDGRPILIDDGFAKLTQKYDKRGNEIEQAYFGVNGQPVLNNDGVAKVADKYDEFGNRIEESTFGVDGKPMVDKAGTTMVRYKYDERGNGIEEAYFGLNGNPELVNGYARVVEKYDELGNSIEWSYFGLDGRPAVVKGNLYWVSYQGPPVDRRGAAKWTFKYDERGNYVEQDCFGVDGKPVLDYCGVAGESWKYDEHGNVIENDDLGLDGHLIIGKTDGYAYATHRYDEHGFKTEDRFFDVEGKPIEVKGACRIVYTYDATGKLTKTERFNAKGSLIAAK